MSDIDTSPSLSERVLATMRMVASDLVDRAKLASALGATYGGLRNLWDALGYKKTLTAEDYRLRYERGDIAAAIVDAKPDATWRTGAELIEDEDSDEHTAFEQAWLAFEQRLKVWSVFARADRLSGIGRYAVVLIGAPGNLETPLPTRMKESDIVYLKPYSDEEAQIKDGDWDTDLVSPRFGKPKFYTIKKTTRIQGFSSEPKKVHFSRVIHVTDSLLDDEFFGIPRLQKVWNKLDDLDKVVGGGSEAVWLTATPLTQYDVDPEVNIKEGEKEKMSEQIDEVEHKLRRSLRTRGVEITRHTSPTVNFGQQADAILKIISGATGIPTRLLTGSERGELASTQDRSNWADRIQDRRSQFADPYIVRPFVDMMIASGALPTPKEYKTRWPEIATMTDIEKGQKALSWAKVNQTMGREVLTGNEIRDHCFGLEKRDELDEEMDPLEQFGSKQREDPNAEDDEGNPKRPADKISDDEDRRQQRAARREAERTH